ncbi:hypothetical protein EC835_104225 [Providencia alcalifaciens]|uniref:Fimbrial protein n=2 Tax=Providencia TaxID=586 RepID=A0A4R3NKY5_9GAMM|nr:MULTISPECIES: fimbrial protein [Providencia]MTB44451.1 fimbrial protein [Providencia sp. wls1950]MTC25043.1 fimbrial protein [Providencia sp. wls1938]MTC44368.1 fimbrial protein [Providencia sp. wls1922]TCT35064.1 hypothetical protein EC835_104225 [Providencia alcalifaciens]
MFKRTIIALSLIAVSSATLAAPPVANIAVSGSITPPTCTFNGVEKIDLEYVFDVSPTMFPVSGNLTLDEKTNHIEVVCDATTYLTFTSTDNRADSVLIAHVNNFGLGLFNTDKKVGFYTILVKNLTVKQETDGTPQTVSGINGSGVAASILVDKTKKIGWGTSAAVLRSGKVFAADLDVKPTLSAELKTSTGDANLDGDATLAFAFAL